MSGESVSAAVARVQAPAEIPASCICPWELKPPVLHWQRITTREGCPWHDASGNSDGATWSPERMW